MREVRLLVSDILIVNDYTGNHRNEKLDVSDWTAGSAYEDNYDSSSSGEDSETE